MLRGVERLYLLDLIFCTLYTINGPAFSSGNTSATGVASDHYHCIRPVISRYLPDLYVLARIQIPLISFHSSTSAY